MVRNCDHFCRMLSHLGIPFLYYGLPESRLPAGGTLVSTGHPTAAWSWQNSWHHLYTQRLSKALAKHVVDDPRPQLVASLYGVAQSEVDVQGLPVFEPMVGYGTCWARFKVFPSYAQQTAIYTKQQEDTWQTRFFDTVIPHFTFPSHYHVSKHPQDYLLYLGRDAADKGIAIAKRCAEDTGLPLRIEHTGWIGEAKADLLANARAVLMPTVYIEPFGYVAIEAQMSGTPVITTDWGAFAEIVLHGETGFRCRTAAEFAAAARMAPRLDREHIRFSAQTRFSMVNVAPFYEKYMQFVWQIHNNAGYYTPGAFRNPNDWPPVP
jgi:glycosyltransferase involved in cell wall biosynthesis